MLIQNYISKIMRDKSTRKKVSYVILVLSLLVASCVCWQLRLNAITMSETPICGYAEHIHDESCIKDERLICLLDELQPHIHSDEEACYEYNEILQCEDKEHEHVESCWGQEQTLVCSQIECHEHVESCWGQEQTLVCSQIECYEHNEECYDVQDKEILTCELAECHVHTDNCYEKVYSCELPEHQHESSCYETENEQVSQNETIELVEPTESEEQHTEWSVQSVYYVHFYDFDFGTGDRGVLKVDEVMADALTTPPDIESTPSGYVWDGKWYTDKDCTQEYDFSVTVGGFAEQTQMNGENIYLYPGLERMYNVIFVTNGERIPPLSLSGGESIDLDDYIPVREYYTFDGWYADEELTSPLSGVQTITSDTFFYAKWIPSMVSFNAVRRIEEIESDSFTAENSIGKWYAMVGSTIYVESTYNDKGEGTHAVMWRLNDQTGAVTYDIEGTTPVYLDDVYEDYYLYNNGNEEWNKVFGTEQVPYSANRKIQNTGVTKIYFDYMRARADLVLLMENYEPTGLDTEAARGGGYYDFYSLNVEGVLAGTVNVTSAGNNYAEGVTPSGLYWEYVPAADYGEGLYNEYTIYDIKVGTKNLDAYTWTRSVKLYNNESFSELSNPMWNVPGNKVLVDRPEFEEFTYEMVKNTGRTIENISWTLYRVYGNVQLQIYAIQTLSGQKEEFSINNIKYTIDHFKMSTVAGLILPKEILGCYPGQHTGTGYSATNARSKGYIVKNGKLSVENESVDVGNTTLTPSNEPYTLIDLSKAQELAEAAAKDQGVDLKDVSYVQIFYYDRIPYDLTFNLNYDSDGIDGNDTVVYEDILYGTPLNGYQNGGSDIGAMLERPGWSFMGWQLAGEDAILSETDWDELIMPENDMTIFAEWDKGDFLIEFYDSREDYWQEGTSEKDHLISRQWLSDGELPEYIDLEKEPIRWIWKDYDISMNQYKEFHFGAPLYRQSGILNENGVYVIKVYAEWHSSSVGTTSFMITKQWSDIEENVHHDGITVHLYADGIDMEKKLTLDEENNWTASFDDLPFYNEDGVAVKYSVVEDEVDGYYAEYGEVCTIPSAEEGTLPTYSIEITNTAGYRLPETGGEGTLLYQLIGIIFMSVPMIYWLRKKNLFEIMKKNE